MGKTSEEIRGWIQTLAIIFAGIWAAYTFILKEYIFPEHAPINLTMGLELKRIDQVETGDSNAKSMFPVQIKVVAKNPSTRTIYLLSTAWWAYGIKVEERDLGEKEFDKLVASALDYHSGNFYERYTGWTVKSLVAAGSLSTDTALRPNEEITTTLIIFLPPKYDKLRVEIKIPTSGEDPEGKLKVHWDKSEEYTQTRDKTYRDTHRGYFSALWDKWEEWTQTGDKTLGDTHREWFSATSEVSLRR